MTASELLEDCLQRLNASGSAYFLTGSILWQGIEGGAPWSRAMTKRFLLGVAVLGTAALFVVLVLLLNNHMQTPAVIRARYSARFPEVLQIVEPVKVTGSFLWLDGGTYGLELTDAEGKKHAFCLYPKRLEDDSAKPPPPNLFVGASHPSRPGAQMVALRGPEESELYGILLRWADGHPNTWVLDHTQNPELKDFPNVQEYDKIAYARLFFQRLEGHFVNHAP